MKTAIIVAVIVGIVVALLIAGHSARQNNTTTPRATSYSLFGPRPPAPAPVPQRPVVRPSEGLAPPIQELHPVIRVVDGDTFYVDYHGEIRGVRFIGMDTPETKHPDKGVECYGPEATAEAKRLLDRGYVALTSDPTQGDVDGYGRWLYYVTLPDGTDMAEHMIRRGFAKEYRFRNDYARMGRYRVAQQQAIAERAGLWGACPTT